MDALSGLDLVVRIGASTVTIVGRDGSRTHHPQKRSGQRSIDVGSGCAADHDAWLGEVAVGARP